MKVYINNRNLLTWPKAMSDVLVSQGHEPVFVDNDSTYPPLLDFYEETPLKVLRCGNLGPSAPWRVMGKQDDFYAVTDPDLDLSGVPADWPDVLINGIGARGVKCGLWVPHDDFPPNGLISNLTDEWPEIDGIYANMTAKTVTHGGIEYFDYPVDTRFAAYSPDIDCHRIGGCMAKPPYSARHLPYYITELDDEYAFYLETATNGSPIASFQCVQSRLAEWKAAS